MVAVSGKDWNYGNAISGRSTGRAAATGAGQRISYNVKGDRTAD